MGRGFTQIIMNTLLYVAIAICGALLLTRLAKIIQLPNVTAYLIAGLLLGPCIFNVIPEEAVSEINILSTAALGFIAFSIGGEFKFSNIKAIGSKAIAITFFQATAAMVLVDVAIIVAGLKFGFDTPLAITLGAIATATAPAATLMVVRQYKARGEVTSTLLPVVAMDDAIGLMYFSISISIAKVLASDTALSFKTTILDPILEIVLSLVLGVVVGFAIALAMKLFKSRANRLSIAIAAVLLGTGLSEMYHLSNLLVCMAIGAALINIRNDADKVLELTETWTGPLFLIFFFLSGAELDLAILPKVGVLGAVYFIARSLGKYFGTYIGAKVVKAPDNVRKYLGFTLLPQAGVAIGMAQVSITALPAYADKIQAVVLSATLIYELFGPMVTKLALIKAGEIVVEKKEKKQKAAQ